MIIAKGEELHTKQSNKQKGKLSVTMSQSPNIRLALNEFQASCYSYHKSQSALCETNWLLRVSGCNLTL